jgi:CRP/FNR family cyclic AMP-dependent transcriptional regulator
MSDRLALIPLLSRTGLFGGLAAEDLEACAAAFIEAHCAKGKVIFTRGQPGTHLYLVEKGRIRLSVSTLSDRKLSFRHAVAGDLFGEIAAVDGGPRTADATAITAATVHTLERNAFRALWSARPNVADQVITFLCERLRATTTQFEAVAFLPLEVRLAQFLLSALAGRTAPPGKRVPLDIGFSQGELSHLLGASRPKVNAAMGQLEKAGAVGRTLDRVFCDPDKLAEIANRHADA